MKEKHCLAEPKELPGGPDKSQEQRFSMEVGFQEGFLEEVTPHLCNRGLLGSGKSIP